MQPKITLLRRYLLILFFLLFCPLTLSQDLPDDVPPVRSTTYNTPISEFDGDKLYDETDCLNWEELSRLLFGTEATNTKKSKAELKACKLSHGLECLSLKDPNNPAALAKDTCRCMLAIGKKPVTIEDNNGKKMCYIPAGLGWVSECFENGIPMDPRFPLPYGDARGPGPDPPIESDELIDETSASKFEHYLRWNSLSTRCVPNAECREGGNYIGRRCQCFKNATFDRTNGICSGGRIIQHNSLVNVLCNLTIILMAIKFIWC